MLYLKLIKDIYFKKTSDFGFVFINVLFKNFNDFNNV